MTRHKGSFFNYVDKMRQVGRWYRKCQRMQIFPYNSKEIPSQMSRGQVVIYGQKLVNVVKERTLTQNRPHRTHFFRFHGMPIQSYNSPIISANYVCNRMAPKQNRLGTFLQNNCCQHVETLTITNRFIPSCVCQENAFEHQLVGMSILATK